MQPGYPLIGSCSDRTRALSADRQTRPVQVTAFKTNANEHEIVAKTSFE